VGTWFIRDSNGGAVSTISFGTSGDIPVPGDYDGDGKDDVAIYRSGQWWVNRSSGGVTTQNFGIGSDTAIPRRYLP
jgi:putative transposon-encoded protein